MEETQMINNILMREIAVHTTTILNWNFYINKMWIYELNSNSYNTGPVTGFCGDKYSRLKDKGIPRPPEKRPDSSMYTALWR
jgi:hypothetical protein